MVSQNSSPIGSNLSIQRNKAGLSQEALAARLHVTRQTISNWEGGKSQPDIESLKSLAEALEIPIEYLIYGELDAVRRGQHGLRLKSWCRWLGIAVLVIGFLYGIRSGIFINRQEHLDWQLSDMVSVWIPSLLWGTILLGISRILTLLQDKGPRDTAPCRMSFPRFSGFPGLAFPPRLWYSTVRLPGIPGCFFADPAPFRALRRSSALCYPA